MNTSGCGRQLRNTVRNSGPCPKKRWQKSRNSSGRCIMILYLHSRIKTSNADQQQHRIGYWTKSFKDRTRWSPPRLAARLSVARRAAPHAARRVDETGEQTINFQSDAQTRNLRFQSGPTFLKNLSTSSSFIAHTHVTDLQLRGQRVSWMRWAPEGCEWVSGNKFMAWRNKFHSRTVMRARVSA